MTDPNESARFVQPTTSRLKVMRGGQSIVRSMGVPKPIVLVDTREQKAAPHPLEPPELVRWGVARCAPDG